MDFGKIEQFSKNMETIHNRIFRYVTIGVFMVVGQMVLYWGMPWYGVLIVFVYCCYTMLFTKFDFPIRFDGSGKGRKLDPPWV